MLSLDKDSDDLRLVLVASTAERDQPHGIVASDDLGGLAEERPVSATGARGLAIGHAGVTFTRRLGSVQVAPPSLTWSRMYRYTAS